MEHFDLIVIGAGSGGLVAATTAQRLGLKTALVEKNKIGGECTHYGCVPSKALINTAKLYAKLQQTEAYGLPAVDVHKRLDFASVMEKVDEIVQGVYQHETPDVFERQGISVFVDSTGARFTDATTITIGKDMLSAKNFIICTGSSPRNVDVPGSGDVDFLHNENFWSTRSLPSSIAFIGGGVISAEIGQVLARFGSEVTIMDRNPRLLKVVDEDVSKIMIPLFESQGLHCLGNVQLQSFSKEGTKTVINYKRLGAEESLSVEAVFVASGRQPNTEGMELGKAGIEYTEKGIIVNEYLQTSAPHIYACGDVATPLKFTHTASHQANICVQNILKGNVIENDLSVFPWVIFTDPEIAHVGISEKQAVEKYGDSISVFRVDASIDRFITDRSTTGFLKVIFDENDLVLGADAVGAHAGEWTQFFTIAIKNRIPAGSFADTIFAYPTYSEIVKKAFSRYLRTK